MNWKQVAPAQAVEKFHRVGSPASCSVACDGERIFAFFGSYGMLCYDLAGTELWKKPMGPFQDEFGASSSPILIDGKLILNSDHDLDNFLIALDPITGKATLENQSKRLHSQLLNTGGVERQRQKSDRGGRVAQTGCVRSVEWQVNLVD